jgi:DNA-binding response OmpR family regulator
MSERTIFLLENDNDTRPIFKKVLQDYGYNVLVAVDEEDALQRVNDGFVKSDLLMVNLLGKSEAEMVEFGNLLREKGKTNIPLVVVAAKYDEELEGTINQAGENAYIVYLGEGDELFNLLSSLTNY